MTHSRLSWLLIAVLGGVGAAPPGADEWKYDVVHRHKGAPLMGLVVEQAGDHVLLKCISRKPGRPTILFSEWLPRAEVARVVLADAADREKLARRLQALARERELLAALVRSLDPKGRGDTASGDTVTLRPTAWVGDEKQKALAYDSTYFHLVSNARAEVVELAAVQLEQIYAAYTRSLPPRRPAAAPTTIVLAASLADYQALVRDQGLSLRNPAFFDVAKNRVVCVSELQRLADELDRARRHHEKQRAALKEAEDDLKAAFVGKIPAEVLRPILEGRRDIQAQEETNEAAFKRAQDRLFQRLYHEAFHAYLANFVYPPGEGELPRWLNEGLAQIFETGIVEVGELRVGHANKERLDAMRSMLARGTLPPLADLLRTGPREFLVAHAADRPTSDRAYLASWALAFHLTFERRLLGTPKLDAYTRALHRGVDPVEAFRDLVGKPLPEFEKEYLDYLKKLREDGSAK